jgi:MerR family transcriptional regulator, light-induced transcriptional regulator
MAKRERPRRAEGRLSIGALSRATGIPIETLRTWELRYGFPVPERTPAGHRVYPTTIVARLWRISEALARGHRAGNIVAASDAELNELLAATPAAPPPPGPPPAPGDLSELLDAVEAFDPERLTRLLLADWARLGAVGFAASTAGPLAQSVGDAWAEGRMGVRHEHFLAERLGDLLRSLRMPFEVRAEGPLVVFATLPGEAHGLGLQMAALVVASAGCRVLYLGTDTPTREIAALARDLNARAIAISISTASRGTASSAALALLRRLLPNRIGVVVGGSGAPRRRAAGVEVITDFDTLDRWARAAVSGRSLHDEVSRPRRRRARAAARNEGP